MTSRIYRCKDCNQVPVFNIKPVGVSMLEFTLTCSCSVETDKGVFRSFNTNMIAIFEGALTEKWNKIHKTIPNQTDFEKWLLESMCYLNVGYICDLCIHNKEDDCPFDDDCGSKDKMFKFDYTRLNADMKHFIVEVAKLMEADK